MAVSVSKPPPGTVANLRHEVRLAGSNGVEAAQIARHHLIKRHA